MGLPISQSVRISIAGSDIHCFIRPGLVSTSHNFPGGVDVDGFAKCFLPDVCIEVLIYCLIKPTLIMLLILVNILDMEKANVEKLIGYIYSLNNDIKLQNVDVLEILNLLAEFIEAVGCESDKRDITMDLDGKKVSLSKNPQIIISKVIKNALLNGFDAKFTEQYINFQTNLLKSTSVPDLTKFMVIGIIHQPIEDYLNRLIFFDYESGYNCYLSRVKFYKQQLLVTDSSFDSLRIDNPDLDEFLLNSYRRFRGRLVIHFLFHEKPNECKEFLIGELGCSNERLVTDNFFFLIQVNDLYVLMPKEEIYNLYIDSKDSIIERSHSRIENVLSIFPTIFPAFVYQTYIGHESLILKFPNDDNGKRLASMVAINPMPASTEVKKFQLDDSKINHTVVEFVIPHHISVYNIFSHSEQITFYFQELRKYRDHPHHGLINKINVVGATIGHLLEMEQDKNTYTLVTAVMNESFHPEFAFKQDSDGTKIVQNFFQEEEDLVGARFLPTKIRILKGLKDAFRSEECSSVFDPKNINSDLFSSFSVKLIVDKEAVVTTHNFFTSAKVFGKYTSLYYNKLAELKVYSKDVINTYKNYTINSEKSFNNFIAFLIDNFVINDIRLKGCYRYFWRDNLYKADPKSEPEVQPYLLSALESLCQLQGINVSREINSAEGSIDMLFSYTTPKGKLLKICMEVKNAHHNNVVEGAKTQLVTYLKSQNTTSGVYLVLWYKNKDGLGFQKPRNFNTQEELITAISNHIPKDYNIKPIIIDCTKPTSPSKIRSKDL